MLPVSLSYSQCPPFFMHSLGSGRQQDQEMVTDGSVCAGSGPQSNLPSGRPFAVHGSVNAFELPTLHDPPICEHSVAGSTVEPSVAGDDEPSGPASADPLLVSDGCSSRSPRLALDEHPAAETTPTKTARGAKRIPKCMPYLSAPGAPDHGNVIRRSIGAPVRTAALRDGG